MGEMQNGWIVSDYPDLPEAHIYAQLQRLGVRLTLFHSAKAAPATIDPVRAAGADCVEIEFRNRLDFAASAALRRELRRRPCDLIYATVNKPLAAVLRATIGFPRLFDADCLAAFAEGYAGTDKGRDYDHALLLMLYWKYNGLKGNGGLHRFSFWHYTATAFRID